ncbi:MAG: phage baseplate assembly protein V [Lysobacteraceae bacterium]
MDSANENSRNAANIIRFGYVAQVDMDTRTCRVQSGELLSDNVAWWVSAAGENIRSSAPSVGEQGMLISPEGDTRGAVFLRGMYSTQFPAPNDSGDVEAFRMKDGALLRYDNAAHALSATMPEGGTFAVTSSGGSTINGPLTVNGDVEIIGDTHCTGTATVDTDVIGGGISLKTHRHGGVQSGGGTTGVPQ